MTGDFRADVMGSPAPRHWQEQPRDSLSGAPEQVSRPAPRAPNAVRPMERIKAERRATHYAGRETAPRGSGDKSHNASGSV
jgi:hypothetical protein